MGLPRKLPWCTQLDTPQIFFFENSIFCYFQVRIQRVPKKIFTNFGTLVPELWAKNRAWGSPGVPKVKVELKYSLDGDSQVVEDREFDGGVYNDLKVSLQMVPETQQMKYPEYLPNLYYKIHIKDSFITKYT